MSTQKKVLPNDEVPVITAKAFRAMQDKSLPVLSKEDARKRATALLSAYAVPLNVVTEVLLINRNCLLESMAAFTESGAENLKPVIKS